ncbi:DsrE family protein [Sphingobium subterraneum]|uniref:Putative peroxiredoxin n=1 Tax=Sphingobium subterraneum TaxID=627688 RepID=A0A841J823_9SPHN|nr:putative peroxiredoxin [Sphingobium subterraneum]
MKPPRLALVLLTDDAERLRGGLVLAMAHGALGGEASLFLQLDAVRLLGPATDPPRDGDHRAAGLPSLADLIDEALGGGIAITVCQTGLALANLDAGGIDPRIAIGGAVSFLQGIGGDDRLLVV